MFTKKFIVSYICLSAALNTFDVIRFVSFYTKVEREFRNLSFFSSSFICLYRKHLHNQNDNFHRMNEYEPATKPIIILHIFCFENVENRAFNPNFMYDHFLRAESPVNAANHFVTSWNVVTMR